MGERRQGTGTGTDARKTSALASNSDKGALNVSGFFMDINDLQATVTAGSCSSRVVFNVPQAHSRGLEIEFEAAPTNNFDFAISTAFNN